MHTGLDVIQSAFQAIGYIGNATIKGNEIRFTGNSCGYKEDWEEIEPDLFVIKNNLVYDLGTVEEELWEVTEERIINLKYNEDAISFLRILGVKNVLVMRNKRGEMYLSFPQKKRLMERLGLNCIECRLEDAVKNYETLELCL